MKKSQFYPKKELRKRQLSKLKNLVKYSYENVPYYHKLMRKNNLQPSDIRTLDDLKMIPAVSKIDIQKNEQRFLSREKLKNDLMDNYTGGSTGKPFRIFHCQNYLQHADAARLLSWYLIPGFKLGERTALIWSFRDNLSVEKSFFSKMGIHIKGIVKMNAVDMSEEKMDIFTKKLEKFKPRILRGFPSIIHDYSNYLEERNKKLPYVRKIISSAETLYPHQREKIQDVFQCDVLNSYGSRELSQIAMECPEKAGLHMMMENQIVEIIKDEEEAAPGEKGTVVVTNLNNYGMPFIRYNIGDIALQSDLENCNCGRGLTLMDNIVGREGCHVLLNSGRKIHNTYFIMKFFGIQGVDQFQVIQKRKDHILLLLIGDKNRSKTKIMELKYNIMDELGEGLNVEIEYVDEFIKSRNGKYLMIISDVSPKTC